jgi:hypothetical protein
MTQCSRVAARAHSSHDLSSGQRSGCPTQPNAAPSQSNSSYNELTPWYVETCFTCAKTAEPSPLQPHRVGELGERRDHPCGLRDHLQRHVVGPRRHMLAQSIGDRVGRA